MTKRKEDLSKGREGAEKDIGKNIHGPAKTDITEMKCFIILLFLCCFLFKSRLLLADLNLELCALAPLRETK